MFIGMTMRNLKIVVGNSKIVTVQCNFPFKKKIHKLSHKGKC